MRHLSSQSDLLTLYNAPLNSISHKNSTMLFSRFPEEYLKCLEKLVHNEWYAASFTGNCNNPSMWGHYGDGHKGVCLIFRTNTIHDKPHIKLYSINGFNARKEDIRPSYGYSDQHFYKIGYEKQYPEFDFFKSLGNVTIPSMNQSWYFDEHKNRSTCADAFHDDEDTWRKNYWDTFLKAITTKLEDWRYEDEYRLVLTPMMIDFSEIQSRKLKYQFIDLEGIVFGIKTPEDTKADIIRIIERKCRLENRTDFKFYQAFYSKKDGHIKKTEMTLVKLNV